MGTKIALQPVDVARKAVDVASDRQASDIVMLDIRKVSDFADFFVILTAESTRQIDDLTDEIENALESLGEMRHHTEGTPSGGWVLLDFGAVIVHIFRPEERDYYRLEDAWPSALETVRLL